MSIAAVAKVASPPPDLFALDVSGLLSGKTVLSASLWHDLFTWTVSTGVTLVLVVGLAWLALRAYTAGLDHVFGAISRNMRPDAAIRVNQRATTLSGILRSLGKVVILFLAGMIILSKLGINVAPILASAGIVGLAVGFGAQSLVKDVISGFFILAEDQYSVGDVIDVNGQSGNVEKMNLRITQLRSQNGQLVTIPNGSIGTVVNHSKEWACAVLEVGVAYDADPDKVAAILKELGEELALEMPEKILGPVEVLGIEAFRDSEVIFKMTIKTNPLAQWSVARAYRRKLWYRFQREGIEMPFPQRTLWVASRLDNAGHHLDAGPADPEKTKLQSGKPA